MLQERSTIWNNRVYVYTWNTNLLQAVDFIMKTVCDSSKAASEGNAKACLVFIPL